MYYDLSLRELRSHDGTLLKKLSCPLHKRWGELKIIEDEDAHRYCLSCQKCVINLTDKDLREVGELVAESPDCCVYIAPESRDIEIRGYALGHSQSDPCPFRRIYTARGEEAINQGARNGYWPLVKRVQRSSRIRSWMEVFQDPATGEIQVVGDIRWRPLRGWKRIIKSFSFYPYHFKHEIAAYLIPPDLQVGERVFLTDLIEDRVGVFGNQGHNYRLDSAYAIWKGKDFKIQWAEWKDADQLIG